MKGKILAALMVAGCASAQTSYPPARPAPAVQTAAPAPAAAASPQIDPGQLLARLGQTSSALDTSVAGLHIEKWKTGSQEKNRLQSSADSIRRNLANALPGILQDVRKAPDNLAATFKLYRNVSALYDVLSSLTEGAGSFGPQAEFRDLSQELQQMEALRHNLGDRMEQLAVAKDAEVVRLGAQLKQAQAAIPPKRIVVDANEQPKPKKKKKPSSTTAQTSPSAQQ